MRDITSQIVGQARPTGAGRRLSSQFDRRWRWAGRQRDL